MICERRGKYHALGRVYEMGDAKLLPEMIEMVQKTKKVYNSY